MNTNVRCLALSFESFCIGGGEVQRGLPGRHDGELPRGFWSRPPHDEPSLARILTSTWTSSAVWAGPCQIPSGPAGALCARR